MKSKYYIPPKSFFENGVKDEDFIMEVTEKTFGGRCYRSEDPEERFRTDKFDHIDFWWDSPKKGTIGIDAKGLKKNKRTDKYFDDRIQWLELVGNSGKPGWLYGKCEYIAFRTNTSILFVKRCKLADYAESKVVGKTIVFETPEEFYVPYQRKKFGKQDVTIKVPTSDIEEMSDFAIKL